MNGRLSCRPDAAQFELSIWGRNLTNETWYQTGIRNTAFFGSFQVLAEPRTYGAEVSYEVPKLVTNGRLSLKVLRRPERTRPAKD